MILMEGNARNPTKRNLYNWSSMKMTDEQRQMAEDNIQLVYYIITKKFHRKIEDGDIRIIYNTFDVGDLVGAGYVGLCKGCITYNKEKGFEVSTYLTFCITREVQREMRMNNFRKSDFEPFYFLSLDKEYDLHGDESGLCLLDMIEDERNLLEETELFSDLMAEINNIIDDLFIVRRAEMIKQWVILAYCGYNQTEIATRYGYGRAEVSRCFCKIKKEYDKRRI